MLRTCEVGFRKSCNPSDSKNWRHAFISRGLLRSPVAALMRVGVIGVGAMGQNHARVYSEIADLVGIADPDVKAGGPASNRFNVSYYTDPTHLLREELDAVSVCVPTQHHAKVALEAIQAGVPLLVEKPLATTVASSMSSSRTTRSSCSVSGTASTALLRSTGLPR